MVLAFCSWGTRPVTVHIVVILRGVMSHNLLLVGG